MVSIRTEYQGDLHCTTLYEPSGTILNTDAPADNHGKATSFSPTDLVASALGSCILTVMGLKAKALKLDMVGATATVEKQMTNVPVRRINRMDVTVRVPQQIALDDRLRLEEAAHTCPVHKSLHPDIEMAIAFHWG